MQIYKALKELGWKAEKSLENMCRDTWRWQISNPSCGYDKENKVVLGDEIAISRGE